MHDAHGLRHPTEMVDDIISDQTATTRGKHVELLVGELFSHDHICGETHLANASCKSSGLWYKTYAHFLLSAHGPSQIDDEVS